MAAVALSAILGAPTVVAADVEWLPCADRPQVQCAELEVPLDRQRPGGRTVSLALRRLPAADPDQRLGVLITVAGGPGQRGTDWVYPGVHAAGIAARFDIVSFDPRGTSGETAITCIPEWDPYGDLDRTPDDEAEREALDERTRELAAGCREAHAELLPFIGTADTVRDIEALRVALDEDEVSLLGSSYGSEVAVRYASAFPEHTRAVVLDGYGDPGLAPPDQEVEQAAAFERELDELLVECALRDDCPIAEAAPAEVLDRLLHELDESPIPTGDRSTLRQSDAYEAITGALVRGPRARWDLLHAIASADGGDGRALRGMAERYRADFEESGLDLGTYMAISCTDDGAAWAALSDEDVAALTARLLDVAPRLGPWLWSPPVADDLPPVGLCAMTPPVTPSDAGPIGGAGAPPMLVLAASGDPATPLSVARRAVGQLDDAELLVVRAEGHLVYPRAVAAPDSAVGRCVLETVEAYLEDGTTPGRGGCP